MHALQSAGALNPTSQTPGGGGLLVISRSAINTHSQASPRAALPGQDGGFLVQKLCQLGNSIPEVLASGLSPAQPGPAAMVVGPAVQLQLWLGLVAQPTGQPALPGLLSSPCGMGSLLNLILAGAWGRLNAGWNDYFQ